jgi:hypothetical protein
VSRQVRMWGHADVDLTKLQMQVQGDIDQYELQDRVRHYQRTMGVSVPIALDLAADDMGAHVVYVFKVT